MPVILRSNVYNLWPLKQSPIHKPKAEVMMLMDANVAVTTTFCLLFGPMRPRR